MLIPILIFHEYIHSSLKVRKKYVETREILRIVPTVLSVVTTKRFRNNFLIHDESFEPFEV